MTLAGKAALVTGGAKRVGRALALALAERGCRVAITYRTSASEAKRTLREIEQRGVQGLALKVDQRKPAQVRRAVAQVLKKFRGLDILINNASSFDATPIEKVTDRRWEEAISANLTGPWWFAQVAGPMMKRRGSGKIINLIDVSIASPWPDYLPYSAAKGGLATLTLGLAKALAPEVQVNGIAPGPVLFPSSVTVAERKKALEKTLLKKEGSPDDLVAAALFFLEGSDFVTGVILPVDGGRRLA